MARCLIETCQAYQWWRDLLLIALLEHWHWLRSTVSRWIAPVRKQAKLLLASHLQLTTSSRQTQCSGVSSERDRKRPQDSHCGHSFVWCPEQAGASQVRCRLRRSWRACPDGGASYPLAGTGSGCRRCGAPAHCLQPGCTLTGSVDTQRLWLSLTSSSDGPTHTSGKIIWYTACNPFP